MSKTKQILYLIIIVLTSISSSFALTTQNELTYVMGISLEFIEGEFNIEDVFIIEGIPDSNFINPTHTLKILNKENELLHEIKFSIQMGLPSAPKEWFDEHGNQIYIPNYTQREFRHKIFVPDLEDKYYIVIEDLEGNELFRDKIQKWFGVLVEEEDYILVESNKNNSWIFYLSALIIITSAIGFYIYRKTTKSKQKQNL